MKSSNRTNGLKFEAELCEKLAEYGYWCHNMAQVAAGQPADVIAVRINTAVLIDCKVCSGDKFQMTRVEPNQESAMSLWGERGNDFAYFALKYGDNIYMMHYNDYVLLKRENVKAVPEFYAKSAFRTFDRWVDWMEDQI